MSAMQSCTMRRTGPAHAEQATPGIGFAFDAGFFESLPESVLIGMSRLKVLQVIACGLYVSGRNMSEAPQASKLWQAGARLVLFLVVAEYNGALRFGGRPAEKGV